MKIKSLKCTCEGSPSEWEGFTEKDEAIYIRYRWGRLTIQLSEPCGILEDAVLNGEMLYDKQIGDEYDGEISIEEVMEIIKDNNI